MRTAAVVVASLHHRPSCSELTRINPSRTVTIGAAGISRLAAILAASVQECHWPV